MNDVNNTYFSLVNNPYVKAVILSDDISEENTEFKNCLKHTQENISDRIAISKYLNSIYIINHSNDMVFSNSQNHTVDQFFDQNWVNKYNNSAATCFSYEKKFDNQRIQCMSFVYTYKHLDDVCGTIAINVNIEKLKPQLNSDNMVSYFIDNDRATALFSSSSEMELAQDEIELLLSKHSRIYSKLYFNKSLSIYNFPETNYSLIVKTHNSNFTNMVVLYNILILLYTILVIVFIYKSSKRYALQYYENVSNVIDILSAYDAESDILNKSDEFSYIKENISQLMKQNDDKDIELSQKIIQLKHSQFNALQTQISPHFISNALNIVNLMLLKSGDIHNNALNANAVIAKILLNTLATDKYLIPISKEIEYANDFLAIELLSKDNSFDVEWDIDEKCYNFNTIKFILQPIIENAIEHGLAKSSRPDKHLKIQIKKTDSTIIFTVSDNGVGMSTEKLQEISRGFNMNEFPVSKNIAMLNVHQRIQLIFGTDYGCSIVKSDATGTIIRMTIPLDK